MGALANLGHPESDQTVGNDLRRHGIPAGTPEEPEHDRAGAHRSLIWRF